MIWFGPAGNSDSFAGKGYKKTSQVADYLKEMGLRTYEYQCGRGVRVNVDTAAHLKAAFKENGFSMSLHAPYFISLSSVEEEKRLGSIKYILESAKAADMLGANKIIIHSGSCSKMSREAALELAVQTMTQAQQAVDDAGLGHIHLCPETMGKINQLGTLTEVLELCKIDDRMIPCIDWGHLNARSCGQMSTVAEYEQAFQEIDNMLGRDRLKKFHAHFSKIEYTEKGGEKKHLTFEDTVYGPTFEPLCEMILKYDCCPTIICESAGTQAEDSKTMENIYNEMKKSM